MDDIVSSPVSPNPRKRPAPDEHSQHSQHSPCNKPLNLKGTQFIMPTPPHTDRSSNASPKDGEEGRAASPAPSSSTLSSIQEVPANSVPTSSTNTMASSSASAAMSSQPPKKRRKLTPSEKLEQQRIKEAKAAEKAEKKAEQEARTAEEKRRKDALAAEKAEKKALVDDQKRQKAEEKEQKKREKELEEERKSQAKLKDERKQMRLMNFLKPVTTPAKLPGPNQGLNESEIRAMRRSLSLEVFDNVADQIPSASPAKDTPQRTTAATTPSKPQTSNYRKYFLPFDVQTHTTLAPFDNRSQEERDLAQAIFDSSVNDESLQEKYDLGLIASYADINDIFPRGKNISRGHEDPVPRVVIEKIQASSSSAPIDLTDEGEQENPLSTLQTIPYRYLHFAEDVRPPYYGSYSKYRSPDILSRLRRNPFIRVAERKDTDYDYDSEAEWEEPDEGEDLYDDDEVEKDEDEKAEDAAFLDDEDDILKDKRRLITGDLIPVNTGLCWADEAGTVTLSTEDDCGLNDMRVGFLLSGFTGRTIDPFSTAYWEHELMPPPGIPVKEASMGSSTSRPPLKERNNSSTNQAVDLIGAAQGEKGPINSAAATSSLATQGEKRGRKPSFKTLSKEDLDEFKDAVVGSGLGKIDLCKGLKTRFPKLTMEVIKDTLGSHFAQVGLKREDKRWRLVDAS